MSTYLLDEFKLIQIHSKSASRRPHPLASNKKLDSLTAFMRGVQVDFPASFE
jgi:hypothetical protein